MGVGFAIPINMAIGIKQQLIASGTVTRGYLGVYLQEITPDLATSFGLENTRGILVADIIKDSAAEAAGLEQGDVILQLDGRAVRDVGTFRNEVSSRPPQSKIRLTVLRKGKEVDIEAVIRAMSDEDALSGTAEAVYELLGMRVDDVTPETAERFGYSLNEGVVITEVRPDGRSAQAGLRPGILITGVNFERTRNTESFRAALATARASGRLVLRVRIGRYHQYVAIRLD